MKSLLHNLPLLFLLYFLCRVVYICKFWNLYGAEWQQVNLWQLPWGGLRFDTAAIFYTNFILMCLLPLTPRVRDNRPKAIIQAYTQRMITNQLTTTE